MTKTLLEKKIESGFFGNMISAKKEIGSIVFYYQFFDAKKVFLNMLLNFVCFEVFQNYMLRKL